MAIAGKCTITRNSIQIAYEGRDKLINALRKAAKALGLTVVSGSMGLQVTPVGIVKLNMMTVFHDGDNDKIDALRNEINAIDSADVFNGM